MDQDQQEWLQLKDKYYQFYELYKLTPLFKQIELKYMKIAIARYGGPIAITKDPIQLVLDKKGPAVKDYICMFANNGDLIGQAPLEESEKKIKIVCSYFNTCFEFIEDEILLCVKEQGDYFLLDPLKRTKNLQNLGERFKTEKILEGQVYDNSLCFLTTTNQFYFVPNLYEPYVSRFCENKVEVKSWKVVSPRVSESERVEVWMAHPEAGIVVIVEDEKKMDQSFYNKNVSNQGQLPLPYIPKIELLAISPNFKLAAFITFLQDQADQILQLHILSTDFLGSIHTVTQLDEKKLPKTVIWCSEHCVILSYPKGIVLVGPNCERAYKLTSKGYYLYGECDGIRLLTPTANTLIRCIPSQYLNIFQQLSFFDPGNNLFEAYISYENRNPLPDDTIRNDKEGLVVGVKACVTAASFEIQHNKQVQLLKAAAYGKCFLNGKAIDQNIIRDVCKLLRVVQAVKDELHARTITYEQLQKLLENQEVLIKILLRYRLHYLAIEICKHLDLNLKLQFIFILSDNYLKLFFIIRESIYINWACCKVESEAPDDIIANEIFQKLKNVSGISFTEIANRAIDIGKGNLATKLLEYEPQKAKKVPLLLYIGNYETALRDAIESKDSNLINMVILKLLKNQQPEEYIFELMSRHIVSMQHLLTYYKNQDEIGYYNYIKYLRLYEEGCYGSIQQAYSAGTIEERVKFLEFAFKFMEGIDKNADQFTKVMIGEQLERLKDILRSGVKNATEETVTNQVLVFLQSDAWKEALALSKACKIPDRRFNLLKCRALIIMHNYSDLDRLLKEKNKKTPHLIPYDIIVSLLLKENAIDLAEMYAEKIPEIETQVQVLRNMGKVQKACEVAYKKGLVELVEEIRITSNSAEISAFIERLIQLGPPGK